MTAGMRTLFIFSAIIACVLCSSNIRSSAGAYTHQNQGISGGAGPGSIAHPGVSQAEWNGGQGSNQADWGGIQLGNQANQRQGGQNKLWAQQGAGRLKNSGGTNDREYGANIIDTPEMVGYEATFPGGRSRYVQYRLGRSGSGNGQQQGL